MTPRVNAVFAALAVMAGAVLWASPASAGCALELPGRAVLSIRQDGRGPLRQGVAAQPVLRLVSASDEASIVGFWKFTFTSQGNQNYGIPDGVPIDFGFWQWHSDGTEMINSARDPATANFCLGAWASTGPRSYKINHYGLSWDNTGQFCTPPAGASSCMVGPMNAHANVTVAKSGDTFTGTITIDQYDTSGNLLISLNATVAAERITAD